MWVKKRGGGTHTCLRAGRGEEVATLPPAFGPAGILGLHQNGSDFPPLPEIAPCRHRQFELMTAASRAGVIQGGAGSGKTTIGYTLGLLAYSFPDRLVPQRIWCTYGLRGLVQRQVLPALGIDGVGVHFREWGKEMRARQVVQHVIAMRGRGTRVKSIPPVAELERRAGPLSGENGSAPRGAVDSW